MQLNVLFIVLYCTLHIVENSAQEMVLSVWPVTLAFEMLVRPVQRVLCTVCSIVTPFSVHCFIRCALCSEATYTFVKSTMISASKAKSPLQHLKLVQRSVEIA